MNDCEGLSAYHKLMKTIAIMERASSTKSVASSVREMCGMVREIEDERSRAVDEAAAFRSKAYRAEMDVQRREADAYARGVADGYRECAEQIAKKIGYEPCS